jgi:hypothetical protein
MNRKKMENKPTASNTRRLNGRFGLSRLQLVIFVAAFAVIGIILYKSFAAGPLVASLEGEQMTLPAGASLITDASASGGQALLLAKNGSATGSFNLPSAATSLTVNAKAVTCQGSPTMTVSVDGRVILNNIAVGSSSWNSYSGTVNLTSGTHSLSISFNNDNNYSKKKGHTVTSCSRDLYIDVTNLYGTTPPPPPPPAISISATPQSLTAGSAATLNWSSTNANSCTASGAWSGSEPTSGSTSTGSLNTTSTYTLTCIGSGGTTANNTTVTVTTVNPPAAPTVYIKPLSQTFSVGSTFTVEVHENSGSQMVNVVQANFSYPTNLLTFVSADTSASAFQTEAQNVISGGSAVLGRGTCGGCAAVTGDQLVETITFRVAAAGTANLTFINSSMLVTSDTNQNILNLSNTGNGIYTLQ